LVKAQSDADLATSQILKLAARTFGSDPDGASARMSERLTTCLEGAGLDDRAFTRLPLGRRALRGGVEIGWSVQGTGELARVVDFLYLLDRDETLHRIEGLVVSPNEGDNVLVQFRYVSLVISFPP